MTNALPTIAGFWFGSDLSWLEALCIRSYLDNGHRFVLYTAHPVKGVPDGADVRHASEVYWPPPFNIEDNDRQRVAVFSDIFRLKLCQITDFIWVDLDAYCVRPFRFDVPHVFGCTQSGSIPNGILRLPAASPALSGMLDFVTAPNPTQPWRGQRLHRRNASRIAEGERWGVESLPWGCSGPKALEHFLKISGEDRLAQPPNSFYPLEPKDLWRLHDPNVGLSDIEKEDVLSVHIYGHQKKQLAKAAGGLPVPGSYLDHLCHRHGIDAEKNPITPLAWMVPRLP